MSTVTHIKSKRLQLRREVIAYFGTLAVLFQIFMPLTSATAAELSRLTQSALNSDVICVAGGRLVAVNGEASDKNPQHTACEFCRFCQFSQFGQVLAPDTELSTISFILASAFWSARPHVKNHPNTDYANRPVRAPPYVI